MSKFKNMTYKNALTYSISKLEKSINGSDIAIYEIKNGLLYEIADYFHIDFCFNCPNDDFGYCSCYYEEKTFYEQVQSKYCVRYCLEELKNLLKEI